MGWWESVDEVRTLVAPDPGATGCGAGHLLSLRHPKSGNATCYLFVNDALLELHWIKQSYGSWFLGNYVCEDGQLYTATPVDPVFIMLPIFEEARMKKGDDPGKFRPLDEIIFIDSYPGYQHLLSLAEKAMEIVCEIKEIGSLKFFRLDDSKVLAWLYIKVHRLKETLPTLDKNYAARNEKDTVADAVSILGEYVKDEPWLKLLCNNLKLELPEVNKKAPEVENFSVEAGSSSFKPPSNQEKSVSEKKTTRSGGRQLKKAKVETESKNIKDMFRRASKRGS